MKFFSFSKRLNKEFAMLRQANFIFVISFFSITFFVASLSMAQIKNEDAVSVCKGDLQLVMINIFPYISLLGSNEKDREKNLLNLLDNYVGNNYVGEKNINSIELQLVLIKDLDEYARPDFSNRSCLGKIKYIKGKNKGFKKMPSELNIGLLEQAQK